MVQDTQPITVKRFRDLPEAWIAQAKLEACGIRCLLADENMVRMDWLYSNMIGGIRLQVIPEDADTAREILEEGIPPDLAMSEGAESYIQPRCPKCDSLDIGFESINHFWSYGLWLIAFPLPIPKNNWKCYSCGTEWIDDQDFLL